MRFTLNYFTKRQPFLTPTIPEKFVSLLRDRIDRSVLSLSVSTENTSTLFSRGSSESKRRTLLVLPSPNSFKYFSQGLVNLGVQHTPNAIISSRYVFLESIQFIKNSRSFYSTS